MLLAYFVGLERIVDIWRAVEDEMGFGLGFGEEDIVAGGGCDGHGGRLRVEGGGLKRRS